MAPQDYTIRNLSRRTMVASSCREHAGLIGKATGLMFARRAHPIMFTFRGPRIVSLHMFFVLFRIDVLWVDAQGKVVEVLEGFRPFHTHTPSARASRVVELPHGAVSSSKTRQGDILLIIPA